MTPERPVFSLNLASFACSSYVLIGTTVLPKQHGKTTALHKRPQSVSVLGGLSSSLSFTICRSHQCSKRALAFAVPHGPTKAPPIPISTCAMARGPAIQCLCHNTTRGRPAKQGLRHALCEPHATPAGRKHLRYDDKRGEHLGELDHAERVDAIVFATDRCVVEFEVVKVVAVFGGESGRRHGACCVGRGDVEQRVIAGDPRQRDCHPRCLDECHVEEGDVGVDELEDTDLDDVSILQQQHATKYCHAGVRNMRALGVLGALFRGQGGAWGIRISSFLGGTESRTLRRGIRACTNAWGRSHLVLSLGAMQFEIVEDARDVSKDKIGQGDEDRVANGTDVTRHVQMVWPQPSKVQQSRQAVHVEAHLKQGDRRQDGAHASCERDCEDGNHRDRHRLQWPALLDREALLPGTTGAVG